MTDPLPVTPASCRGLRWLPRLDDGFASRTALVPLQPQELGRAAAAMPLAFVRRGAHWEVVGVCGLAAESSLFVDEGHWLGAYRPTWLDLWPFAAVETGKGMVVTMAPEARAAGAAAGEVLFDAAGQPSPALAAMLERLQQWHRQQATLRSLTPTLAKARLLMPWPDALRASLGLQIEGLHCVDERALNALDDRAFAALRQTLPIAFAVNLSMGQVHLLERLRRWHEAKTPNTPDVAGDLEFDFSQTH
ncbi:MAG: hypothetical protein EA356_14745 [Geminicoccaceae bacterium]|nr:MAG: hypothetical protein EA356_14745 [Geminicoccaceae bacterium]